MEDGGNGNVGEVEEGRLGTSKEYFGTVFPRAPKRVEKYSTVPRVQGPSITSIHKPTSVMIASTNPSLSRDHLSTIIDEWMSAY
jgi:hypothetical protein